MHSEITAERWGWRPIDILIVGKNDYSDYVEAGGISLTSGAISAYITDLDGNKHSKRIANKQSFSATLGLVPDSIANRLDADIDSDSVQIKIQNDTRYYIDVTANRTASYSDGLEIFWDVTLQGNER